MLPVFANTASGSTRTTSSSSGFGPRSAAAPVRRANDPEKHHRRRQRRGQRLLLALRPRARKPHRGADPAHQGGEGAQLLKNFTLDFSFPLFSSPLSSQPVPLSFRQLSGIPRKADKIL